MFRSFLNRILVPEHKQPEVVCWSPNTRGHSSDQEGGKGIIHGDVILSLSAPQFGTAETRVYIAVSNTGRKALGFGATGIGLVLNIARPSRNQNTSASFHLSALSFQL